MHSILFRRIADSEGWNEATQIGLLLSYIEAQRDMPGFAAFLARSLASDLDVASDLEDRFMNIVAELLDSPGLILTTAFQLFCLNSSDLLTPRQAADRWRCWSAP